jgi:hypothetical protein
MNCRISEFRLRGVCRELLGSGQSVSHRALRNILQERFGATGKTARVLKVWREELARWEAIRREPERPASAGPAVEVRELQERLAASQSQAADLKARAELAELREQSHQERWGLEIDRLREQLRAQPNYAREAQSLQNTVTRLTVELAALRGAMADRE